MGNRFRSPYILGRLLARVLPDAAIQSLIFGCLERMTERSAPADALRALLELDNTMYGMQTEAAIRFEGDTHPKHRLTAYHDFFVSRINRSDRVLDIGCGMGALAQDIAERTAAHVVAVDIQASLIETARTQYAHPQVTYIHGDARTDLPDGPYSVVVLSNVLEHLSERIRFLRRVRETTAATRFLIRVPLLSRDWRVPLKRELGLEYRLDPTHEIEYTHTSFDQEMTEAGLQIVHKESAWGEIWSELCASA